MEVTLTETELRSQIAGLCYDLTGAYNEEAPDSTEIGAIYYGWVFRLRQRVERTKIQIRRTDDDSFLITVRTMMTRHGILWLVADPVIHESGAIWTAGYLKTLRRLPFPVVDWIDFDLPLLVVTPMIELQTMFDLKALYLRLTSWKVANDRQVEEESAKLKSRK